MKWSNESFPLFHARKLKSGSKLNLDCHQAELLQPCPTYGRGDRPGTPRPHRYEYTHPDAHQPPIVPSRYERSSRSYAPRPTPYGERPARHTRRSKDEGNLLSIGGYSDPDYRKGGSKKVLERATSGLSKLRDSFNPLRSKVRPRHQLKELGPYRATISTERATDAMVVDDYYGSPTPYQRNLSDNHNVSLEPRYNGDTSQQFTTASSSNKTVVDLLNKNEIDEILNFSVDITPDKNSAQTSSRDAPKHEPTVSDHIPRSSAPVSREHTHPVDDRVEIQHHARDTSSVERHARHGEPPNNRKPSMTRDAARDTTSRKTANHELDHIPRSIQASSHRRTRDDTQEGHHKNHHLDTSPKPPSRSCRGIENNHATHRRTRPEPDPVDGITNEFSSIRLEDRAIGSRRQHASSRPRPSPYGRNHERRRIVEESRSQRPWNPTPGSCRPGLQMSQENFNNSKEMIMYIVLSREFPAEYWVAVGLSREVIFYAFTELGLRLPPNMDFDGFLPYARAHEDGFDNMACKQRVWNEIRAEQLVKLECDQDTMMSRLMNLSLSEGSSNHPTIY